MGYQFQLLPSLHIYFPSPSKGNVFFCAGKVNYWGIFSRNWASELKQCTFSPAAGKKKIQAFQMCEWVSLNFLWARKKNTSISGKSAIFFSVWLGKKVQPLPDLRGWVNGFLFCVKNEYSTFVPRYTPFAWRTNSSHSEGTTSSSNERPYGCKTAYKSSARLSTRTIRWSPNAILQFEVRVKVEDFPVCRLFSHSTVGIAVTTTFCRVPMPD